MAKQKFQIGDPVLIYIDNEVINTKPLVITDVLRKHRHIVYKLEDRRFNYQASELILYNKESILLYKLTGLWK